MPEKVIVKACGNTIEAIAAQSVLIDAGIDSVLISQGGFINPEIQFTASVNVAVEKVHEARALDILFPRRAG